MNFLLTALITATMVLSNAPTATASPEWHACRYEDGSGQARCVWDAKHMGNGEGNSVKIIAGGTDDMRVIRISHRKAHRLAGI